MSIENLMERWKLQTTRMSRPKIASFCGMPDPVALKQALDSHDMVVILVYRPFGISVRKAKWRVDRSSYMDQYWRRVWVKVGEVDKNRIQVFCLPITNVLEAPAVLESLVNGRFKNYSIGLTSDQEASQLIDYQVEFYPVSDSHINSVDKDADTSINTEAWYPPAGFDRGLIDLNQYELKKTDDATQLDTLVAMTDNYINKSSTDQLKD